MPAAIRETIQVLELNVQGVPIGTNLGLLYMLWALLNGSFLSSRGAIFPALQRSGFDAESSRRSWAALRYGAWTIEQLLEVWRGHVLAEGKWQRRSVTTLTMSHSCRRNERMVAFEATGSGSRAVQQMPGDLTMRLIDGEFRQRECGCEQGTYIGSGESRQYFESELLQQIWVASAGSSPSELLLSDEPEGTSRQSGMMLPGQILLSLEVIPAAFIFGIFKRPFHEIATAGELGQCDQGGISRGVAEGIGATAASLAPDDQPLLAHSWQTCLPCPHPTGGELSFEITTLGSAQAQRMPMRTGIADDVFDHNRVDLIEHPQALAVLPFLTIGSRRHPHFGTLEIDAVVARHVGGIANAFGS